jgi:putative ABC transport system ATP-binding protein
MTSRDEHQTPTTPDGRKEVEEAAALLAFLGDSIGETHDPHLVRKHVREALELVGHPAGGHRARFDAALVRAGLALGIRIFRLVRPPQDCPNLVHGPVVVIGHDDDAPLLWAGVLARLGPMVQIHTSAGEERTVRFSELGALVGNPQATLLEWLVAESAEPLRKATEGSTVHGDALGITAQGDDEDGHGHGHGGGHSGPDHLQAHFSSISPQSRLIGLLRAERSDLWVIVIYSIAIGVLSLGVPIAVQSLVNNVGFGSLLQPIVVLTFLLLGALALSGGLKALQIRVLEYIQRRVFVKVAIELAQRLPRAKASAFDGSHGPELVNRFFDVLTVQKSGATLLLDGLSVVLQGTIGMLLLAFYHPLLLAFDVVLLAALLFIVLVLGRRGPATSIAESRSKYAVAAWLEELARHPHAFKAGGAQEYAIERADQLARRWVHNRKRHFGVVYRQTIGALILQALAAALLLGLGGWLVIERQLTLGQLVAAELVVGSVLAAASKLGKQLESYYDLLAAMDKLGHLFDLELEPEGGGSAPRGPGGVAVRVRHLGFGYSEHNPVIDHLDFDLEPGERLAVVGRNGSGKSTLVDLLYGMRPPHHGSIEIDGVDVREISVEELRTIVAVVRGIELFSGSISDNVRLGRHHVSTADVRWALKTVGLWEDVLALPDGLDAQLQTGGSPLSLGQIRRLMLARAIASRPRLLVLDEAVDGIDGEAWDVVLAALLGGSQPWTVLCATHNAAVRERCGRELRLSDGHLEPGHEHVAAGGA